MPSPASTRQARGKRDAILDAALELFAERGFYGTAVPLVAEAAGVAAGTLYRYFESKEALVNALYQREKLAFMFALMQDFPTGRPPREQFRELWKRLSSYARSCPKSASFLELHHHAPYLDARSRALEDQVMGPLEAFVKTGQEQGAIAEMPPRLAIALVYGAFIQLARAAWAGQLDATDSLLALAEQRVWEAVRR